jgi:hypothetical protein
MSEWQELKGDFRPSGRVLVCTQLKEVTAASYAAGLWWRDGDKAIHAKVTHWMPLPEPPSSTAESSP